jgi:hypothetical protein
MDRTDLKQAFAKDTSEQDDDQEETSIMQSLSPLGEYGDNEKDKRKGMFYILTAGQIALAAVMYINNDHQEDSGGWSEKYKKRNDPNTDKKAYGKWNIKGGRPAFGSGLDPKAMTMYEQVKVMSDAIRNNQELMKELRVESLDWWDKHGTKDGARKRNVKGKSNVVINHTVPVCPPLDMGFGMYDETAASAASV